MRKCSENKLTAALAAGVVPSSSNTFTTMPARGAKGTSTISEEIPTGKVARTLPLSPLKFPLGSRPTAVTVNDPAATPAML